MELNPVKPISDLVIWGLSGAAGAAGAAMNGAGELIGDGLGAANRAIRDNIILKSEEEPEPEPEAKPEERPDGGVVGSDGIIRYPRSKPVHDFFGDQGQSGGLQNGGNGGNPRGGS